MCFYSVHLFWHTIYLTQHMRSVSPTPAALTLCNVKPNVFAVYLLYSGSWQLYVVNFDVLLTVHLGIFILVINQIDAQNLFYNKFISYLYMFRTPCAHRQKVRIVLYSLWYHHTETSEWSKITKITKITKTYAHIYIF